MRKLMGAAFALLVSTAAAHAVPVVGTYSISQTGSATITNLFPNPYSLDLTVGTPTDEADFFNETEAANAVDTITATFNLTQPGIGTGSDSAVETFSITGRARHDSLVWGNGGLIEIALSDGSLLHILLGDASFNGVNTAYSGLVPTISFELVRGPAPASNVPEPATLALFGAGIAGLGALARRRKPGKA